MFRIPIINQNERFLDIDEKPLVRGKIEILDPVSNNFLDVWVYSDDEYYLSDNPVILDIEGRTEQTIFCDRIVYIRVYKYQGMDENNHPIYQFIRDYYTGENENTESREYITGMDALRDLDPSVNSSVNVLGYHNAYDCQMRTYVWDPNCTLDQDGGYIIGSNIEATGRWILQFDGPYIPSSFYGVYPGHLTNINALATYVDEIKGKRTAMGIYFIPGHYENAGWITTTKKVLLSANTQFDMGIECTWVDVKGKPTTWIADILPTDSTCPVYSSWYKNARSFWSCASKHKHCDGRNWTNNQIISNIGNNNVTFYTEGAIALTTDTGAYYLTFTQCQVEGTSGFLHKDSKCKFFSMPFSDKYYVNHAITPANIEFNTTPSLPNAYCTMDADNFATMENLAAVAYKNGISDLDLKNHYCGSNNDIDLSQYNTVRNLNANMALLGKSGYGAILKNSNVNYLKFNGTQLSIEASDVRLTNFPNLTTFNAYNGSTVTGGWYLTRGNVNCVDSNWFMQINEAPDNTGAGYNLVFRNSIINATINTKHVELYDCQIRNSQIKVYPTYNSSNSKYWLYLRLERCNIDNSDNPTIQFTKVDGDNNCKDCWWNVRMIGNDFQGNSLGVTCPFWANRSYRTMFIARSTANGDNTFTYNNSFYVNNNTGNCPKCADLRGIYQTGAQYMFNSNWDPYCSKSVNMKVFGSSVRIWCQYRSTDAIGHTQGAVAAQYAIHGLVADKRMPDRTVIGNFQDQPTRCWFDNWISNATFCLNTLDPNYTGTRDLEELDDWFAARIIMTEDYPTYSDKNITDVGFILN